MITGLVILPSIMVRGQAAAGVARQALNLQTRRDHMSACVYHIGDAAHRYLTKDDCAIGKAERLSARCAPCQQLQPCQLQGMRVTFGSLPEHITKMSATQTCKDVLLLCISQRTKLRQVTST